MPGTTVTGSPNLTLLDSRIDANLCAGKFYVSLAPSVFINDETDSPPFYGANNVLGAKIKITNPYGVVIKSYGLTEYDIEPPMTEVFEYDLPTQAGTVQYGTYTIDVELTDSDGTKHYVSKSVNVSTYNKNQNPCDDRLKLVSSCKNGTLTILLAEPPLFKGSYSQSKTQTIVVNYPTASGHAATNSTYGNFSVQLFEGVYKVVVNVCATYNLGDNVLIRLPYNVTMEKNVKCNLDYSCIYPRIKQLNDKIKSDCSDADKTANASIVLDALRLLKSAELANDAGEDSSDYISDLEELLGCTCTCDCTGSPIVNGTPSTDLAIEGCGVTKETVGLTDIYTINNYSYEVGFDDATGIITASASVVEGCVVNQRFVYNVANNYAAIKALVNNTTEYNFWAGVINNTLNAIDALCLGYNPTQWAALSFVQKMTAIMAKACAGGNCNAAVTSTTVTRVGADVVISWTATNHQYVQIWVDNDFVDAKMAAIGNITLPGYANGAAHTYEVRPFCSNNIPGISGGGTFTQIGCPSIVAPTVSSNTASNVACPYNLNGLVQALPLGIIAEWHNANNTLSSSLVADPSAVTDGTYYVFAKDINGCYSTGVQVVVTCQTSGTVTAPQNLQVTPQFGSMLVSFQSAAFPPPANSYTLKRRLSSDPDISGSYTTLGSTGTGITFNSSTSRWELSDSTAVDNTLYVYRAISNGGSSPYIDYTYANITCALITLTNDATSIGYSFVHVGGGVDKYVVQLYDAAGVTELDSIEELPGSPTFANPITNTFTGLSNGTYKVRKVVYIGTYSYTCSFQSLTIGNNFNASASYNFSIDSVSGTGVPSLPPTGLNGTQSGHHTGISGNITVVITGTLVTACHISVLKNYVVQDCEVITGPGTYVLSSGSPSITDNVIVSIGGGAC
jgi:hypothetical protein